MIRISFGDYHHEFIVIDAISEEEIKHYIVEAYVGYRNTLLPPIDTVIEDAYNQYKLLKGIE